MNIQHLRKNNILLQRLAAEYVLGTLRGGARRRFETWLRGDRLVEEAVAQWNARLCPLAEFAPSVQPPPQTWSAIEKRLGFTAGAKRGVQEDRSFWSGLRDNLNFWRGFGMTAAMLATVLIAVLITQQPGLAPSNAAYVATLEDKNASPVAVITGDVQHQLLKIRILAAQNIASDKSLELWAVPKQGAPHSLGLVAVNGTVTLPLPQNITPESMPLLAVSLEPKGGSPNPNAPTGPILFKGSWVRI